MKKYNEFELVGIGVSVYLICIIFGIISKHIFGFDVDVLSASATLFAGVVAIVLVNDWREQHNFLILEKRHDYLLEKITILRNQQKELILGLTNNCYPGNGDPIFFVNSSLISMHGDFNIVEVENEKYLNILKRQAFELNNPELHQKLNAYIHQLDLIKAYYNRALAMKGAQSKIQLVKDIQKGRALSLILEEFQNFLSTEMGTYINEIANKNIKGQ
ncbi:hypothetical protein KTH93_04670 [Acinetobacter bereziniae]|uniref:hypothetical protein n=1 Tax=Acinetobacter bereziniae TaxID=106648 RepID=UPI0021D12084|nr:hypothetical protein [Acinetobacter bereziniae]MCU4434770.1 hypothetical protein [Acinetobacter bereziniae]